MIQYLTSFLENVRLANATGAEVTWPIGVALD